MAHSGGPFEHLRVGTKDSDQACHLESATAEDLPFLREMLVEAAYWRGGEQPSDVDDALDRPDLRYLLTDWGRAGDEGLVAWGPAGPIGAAWYRLWTQELHSYGFVDPATPELAIGVRPEGRGAGVGTALLRGLLQLARVASFECLSLSVELDNPARRLYERLGFEPYERVEGGLTMLLRLDSAEV